METTSNRNKTWIWVAVGCLVLIVCALAVVLLGFGGLVWLGSRTPGNADIKINAPLSVSVGDEVQIQIYVTNTGTEVLEISSIDFSLNYLNGFTITQVTPAYVDIGQYNSLGGGETFQTYYFHQPLEPGITLLITFDGTAVTSGDFSGAIDVCIDSDFNCATNIPRTVVK